MKSMSGEIHDAKLVKHSSKGNVYKINNWYFGEDMLEFIEERKEESNCMKIKVNSDAKKNSNNILDIYKWYDVLGTMDSELGILYKISENNEYIWVRESNIEQKTYGVYDEEKQNENKVQEVKSKNEIQEKERGNSMFNKMFEKINVNNMFGEMGTIKSGDVATTMNGGLAVKRKDGEWVSFDPITQTIVNQNGFVIESTSKMIMLMPTQFEAISTGDIIKSKETYYYVVSNNGTSLKVLNIKTGTGSKVQKETNLMMNGMSFVSKIVNMAQGMGINPLIMMATDDGDSKGFVEKMMEISMASNMFGGMFGGQAVQPNVQIQNPLQNMFSGMFGQPVAQQQNSEEVDKLTKTLEEQAQIIRDLKEQLESNESKEDSNREKEQQEESKAKSGKRKQNN